MDEKQLDLLSEQKSKIKPLCVVMTILIMLRGFSDIFIYPAIAVGIVTVLVCKPEHSFMFLLYLLPFGSVFKIAPDQMSMFTVLYIVFLLKLLFYKFNINLSLFFSVIVLFGYMLTVSGLSKLITIITMTFGLVMVNQVCRFDAKSFPQTIRFMAGGMISSSIIGIFRYTFPLYEQFLNAVIVDTSGGGGVNMVRLTGLLADPNYYGLSICIILACLVIMILREEDTKFYVRAFMALSLLGFLSISKSFIITWSIVVIFLIIGILRTSVNKIFPLIAAVAVFGIIFYILFGDMIFSYYSFRFEGAQSQTMAQFTTGRTAIWEYYIDYMLKNPTKLLLGSGVNNMLAINHRLRGTHNFYIEIVYSLGLVGTLLYFICLKSAIKLPKIKIDKKIYLIPIFVLAFDIMSLGYLTDDFSCFFFAIICYMTSYYKQIAIEEEYAEIYDEEHEYENQEDSRLNSV